MIGEVKPGTGTLKHGALVAGVRHRVFELRLPTVGDNVEAVEEVGSHNPVALNAAVVARQVVRLGTLKPEQITYDLLCTLHPKDFNQLDQAATDLEKNFWAELEAEDTSSSAPGSPSSS